MLLDQTDLILSQLPLNFKTEIIMKKMPSLFRPIFLLLYNPFPQVFIETINFVNTSNTTPVFVNKDSLIKKHNIMIKRLLVPKPLRFTNRFLSGFITHYFTVTMIISYHTKSMLLYVTKLLPFILVIFKILWLKKYNLKLDFPTLGLKFNSNYYACNCFLWHIFGYN